MKIACFCDFLHKNQFLPIFYTQNGHFSIFVGVLTLWRHSDVILEWLVLILVSMERGCPYTLVVNLGLYALQYWKSRGGVATTPSENMFGKTIRVTRVNPSSPKGGNNPPNSFRTGAQNRVKLLRVPSSSPFSFILAKQFRTYHLHRGWGKLSKLGGRGGGGWCDPVIFRLDYFKNNWSDMHSKLCLQVRMAIF